MNDLVGSESEADARLIAQAKNMRDALIDAIGFAGRAADWLGEDPADKQWKSVIEAATGLTWEQIKGMKELP